ncbi:BTB domain-containing protein [Caenorhabditis elegans]|uniref:BTB domain-containing protein n=1 Tax=Caenorhabditis elegans TaxID=6239 RepID=A0PD34_CAEEL|nr:BTB domain-containing protein [Caenorhabditis elegans]CAL69870.2 BTB domain-containing protein [Caenorhabditis elegans]
MTSVEDVITLNVGGTMYTTTRSTLSKETDTLLANIASGSLSEDEQANVVTLPDGTLFVDRDGPLFAYVLHFLRTDKLSLPEQFREVARLKDEADFYRLERFSTLLSNASSISPRPRTANGYNTITSGAETGGYITLGYRGTFAFGRDGQADVKFRKLHRILVCGRATLCREVFADTLNESRDPGGPDDGERYTSRLYLKHQCLERACDLMAEKGFKLVATCCSGANGLAAANHPILTSNMGNINQTELMNHRNCGDYEEQRWAHYTEYVFFREPQSGYITPTSREL